MIFSTLKFLLYIILIVTAVYNALMITKINDELVVYKKYFKLLLKKPTNKKQKTKQIINKDAKQK